ncbi:ankyrin repeat-containing domain protein [Lasiosphaeria ovina]|uniref:Ankyrin repeat-containing domain protein n=1 Tax=Lasiosphaeria ovina TaxID=92902 RepID=A0AAE0NMB3_9PEZI|nr:ankyrin repeat-containing domain protein [Lasiosphaeria ovina]
MDPLSTIASTIAIIQAISSTYKAIQHLRGLPKIFEDVNQRLPLVEYTLTLAHGMVLDESSRKIIGPVIGRCEEKAEALRDIFQEVEKRKNEANDRPAYDIFLAMSSLGKANQAKTLMQEIEGSLVELSTVQIAILKTLHTSPYLDRKNRNPDRVPGTCEWFVNHQLFRKWQESSSSSMLWVSADPGCGKSVLARHLVDSELRTTTSRTTCYFFFKDDFDDQRSAKSALCCILHQLFTQREILFSSEIVKRFEAREIHLTDSFDELWEVLIMASQDKNAGEIVCILDAFDECEDQEQSMLAQALCKLYRTEKALNLKFLITSRPHGTIRRGFQPLDMPGLPLIHLSGESEVETDKIAREIDIYIRARVQSIRDRLTLSLDDEQLLLQGLLRTPNRTYLWVHLTMDLVQDDIGINKVGIRKAVSSLPPTVDHAYEGILNRSHNPEEAKKLLHVVVGAARPLTLAEMAVALALQPDHRSYEDLDLKADKRFREYVRDLCGLFITITDSKIYLLHQTAREFLVQDDPSKGVHRKKRRLREARPKSNDDELRWKSSLQPRESHRILCQICVWHLLFTEFETHSLDENEILSQYLGHVFLDYSAKNWASHSRGSGIEDDDAITDSLLAICDARTRRCLTWFRIYWADTKADFPQNFTTLMIASYFGLERVVKLLLKRDDVEVNSLDGTYRRSALSWASENGFDGVVKLLIRGPKFHFRHLARSPFWKGTDVDVGDRYGRTPLSYAAWNGHMAITRRLVRAKARVDSVDEIGGTPISYALCSGHEVVANKLMKGARAGSVEVISRELLTSAAGKGHKTIAVVRLLLEKGANIEARATKRGHEAVVRLLVEKGANIEARAAESGHEAVLRLLLEKGANIEARGNDGRTALWLAAYWGHEAVVRLLLEKGANMEARGDDGRTALYVATERWHEAVVRLLLKKGANMEARGDDGRTALRAAAYSGHMAIVRLLLEKGANIEARATESRREAVVRLLLEKGANMEAKGDDGRTALWLAAHWGHEAVVRLLLKKGANIEAAGGYYSRIAICVAANSGHEAVVRLLLEKGANIEARGNDGRTALWLAAYWGHEAVVRLLLEKGANMEARGDDGRTALYVAAERGHGAVVRLLQPHRL